MSSHTLPVAVIGAGPVGLAAAAHLLARGEEPVVFEAGQTPGTSVLSWGHVRLFSPWRYVIDQAAAEMLSSAGWQSPDPDAYPTGRDLVEHYLLPLASLPALRPRIRLATRVLAVTRVGLDKMKTDGRDRSPFLLMTRDDSGPEEPFWARAVIDASGTYLTPNPAGAAGVPALGEREAADRIFYGIPDVLGTHRQRYAGRRVMVVGSGHSAFNVLADLVALRQQAPETHITWVIRRSPDRLGSLFGGGHRDALPARAELGARVQQLVRTGQVHLVAGFNVARLSRSAQGLIVASERAELEPVDEIIATTGFRPDLSLLSELRLGLDPAVESPVALAPLIDPNVHSCGTVPPHGEAELRHPEPGFYIAGMKSYGRAPTFLLLTGYEQVRSIASALAGDWEAARQVRLVLPETGVCSSGILREAPDICCGAGATLADDLPRDARQHTVGAAPGGAACCGVAES